MAPLVLDPRFAEAIRDHDLSVDLTFDDRAARALRATVDRAGALLLGELHGIAQNASVIYELMTALGIRRLALEWEPELRPVIDRFLATGRIDLALHEDESAELASWPDRSWVARPTPRVVEAMALLSSDGRVTAGHFAALRALREENRLEQLILFQAGGESWSERDRAMAGLLLGEWDRQGALLVVAGNLHTRLQEHRFGLPLGHHVVQVSEAAEIGLDYATGRLDDGIDVQTLIARAFDADHPNVTATGDGAFRILLPEAHPAVLARLTPAG